MRKVFIAFIAITIFSTGIVFASDLGLDPSVFKDKSETYSSITDIYNIPIFTDEYKENIEKKQENEKVIKDSISKKLFSSEKVKRDSSYEENKKIEEYQLFNKAKNEVYIEIKDELVNRISHLLLIALSVLLIIITFISTNKFYKNKSKKGDEYVCYFNHKE